MSCSGMALPWHDALTALCTGLPSGQAPLVLQSGQLLATCYRCWIVTLWKYSGVKRPTERIVACEHWNARYVPVSGFERCRLTTGDVFRVLRLVANQLRWFSPA